MQLIEIATQTGILSYNAVAVASNNTSPFFLGFTGVTGTSNVFIGFSGNKGLLYDNQGNFFGGYQPGVNINLSGFIYPTYHNYFWNGNLINTNCARPTGYLEGFIYNTGSSLSSVDVNIFGTLPNCYISGGVFQSGNSTGELIVLNLNNPVRFKIYSGAITVGNYGFTNNYSGWITGEKDFTLISSNPSQTSGSYPVSGTFYTNFGTINTGFSINVFYNYSLFLNTTTFSLGGSGNTGTGIIAYSELLGGMVVQNITMPLSIMLQNSGIVSDVAPDLNLNVKSLLLTGAAVIPNPVFHFSGYITGSGFLNSLDNIQVSGYNYLFNINDTGTLYANQNISVFYYATGNFPNMPWETIGTGLVTGYAKLLLNFSGNVPSGNYINQYNIGGSGNAYYVSGISGTGYSNTFNSLIVDSISGTGYSIISIAYATGTGKFSYSGFSTGLYNVPWTGVSFYGGIANATGIVLGTLNSLSGIDAFTTTINWTGSFSMENNLGVTTVFTGVTFLQGSGIFTGLYIKNTGEMYLTGMISGIGYTGAGFIYSSGYSNYSGYWNYLDSGIQKYLFACSGFASGTPLNAINTGAIYTGTNGFVTTNLTPTIITGNSGFILLSNINAPDIDIIPPIIISGANESLPAPNFIGNNLWLKHNRFTKTGIMLYGITKFMELSGQSFNYNNGTPNLTINTFLCSGTNLNVFVTGFYQAQNFGNQLVNLQSEANYTTLYGAKGIDSGVYIRIATETSDRSTGLFMFVWNTGESSLIVNWPMNIPNTIMGYTGQYFTGGFFSGQTFNPEVPTGIVSNYFCAETAISTGFFQNALNYSQTTGTLLTGIGTGNFVSGYLNYPIYFTGKTGTILTDILINPTGAWTVQQFVSPASFLEDTSYTLGIQSTIGSNFIEYFPLQFFSGGYDYPNNPSGILNSINTGFSGFGFNSYYSNSNIVINYSSVYTGGNAIIYIGENTYNFSGQIYYTGSGLIVNSNLVTGRNLYFSPSVTGYSLWTGIVNINGLLTGRKTSYYSGETLATGLISGQLINQEIYWGSGYYLFGNQTGLPFTGMGIGLISTSGLVALAPFSGNPSPFIGTGYYSTGVNGNPSNYPTGLFYGISTLNTFSGQYTFYTGFNYNQMAPVSFLSPSSGFSGFLYISGSGNLLYTIGKNYSATGDILFLNLSGYNNTTNQSIFLTN